MTTMYDAAVEWVREHVKNCKSLTCGCHDGNGDEMVAALVGLWLTDPAGES